jgi:hypothetical protein
MRGQLLTTPMPATFEEEMHMDLSSLVAWEVQCVLDRDGRYHDRLPDWDAPEEQWLAWEEGKRPLGAEYRPRHACSFSLLSVSGGDK